MPARELLSLYAETPLAVRAHVRVRWATCPFRAVAAQVPEAGRVLEVGCGHGLLSLHLALASRRRRVLGIDIDPRKVAAANLAARQAGDRVQCSFALYPPGELPEGPWDAVAMADVLYLLDADDQHALLRSCAEALGPGGVLVVKEMAPAPRWKAVWNTAQETLAVRLLGLTTAESAFTFLPPERLAGWMADAGLAVRHRPLDRGYPHPHHLFVGRRG